MADDLRLMELDVVSMVHLAKRLVPAMVRRGELRFTASVAATMPGP